jgi:hypothetical protein
MRGSVCDIFCLISGTTARCPIAAIIAIIRPSSDTSLALRSAVIACACRFCSVSQSLEGGFGVGSTQGASSDPMGNEAGAGANRRRSPPISATPFFGDAYGAALVWCACKQPESLLGSNICSMLGCLTCLYLLPRQRCVLCCCLEPFFLTVVNELVPAFKPVVEGAEDHCSMVSGW